MQFLRDDVLVIAPKQLNCHPTVVKETVIHSHDGIAFSNQREQLLMEATTSIDLQSIMLSKKPNQQTKTPLSKSHVMYGSMDYHSRNDRKKRRRTGSWFPGGRDGAEGMSVTTEW